MEWLPVALIGLLMGGVVNLLADDPSIGRPPGLPRYPNGRWRRPSAWLHVTTRAFGLRHEPHRGCKHSSAGRAERRVVSWRYALVAIASSLLITLTHVIAIDRYELSSAETLIWLTQVFFFILIAVIDLEQKRIHSPSLLAIGALAIVRAFAFPLSPPTTVAILVGALCAGLAFSLVYLGGRLFARLASKRWLLPKDVTAFGKGDVYLMTVGGLIVGFPDVLNAMALAILLGGIVALFYLAVKRASGGYQPFTALPYGPYIIASIYVVMLLPGDVNGFIAGL